MEEEIFLFVAQQYRSTAEQSTTALALTNNPTRDKLPTISLNQYGS